MVFRALTCPLVFSLLPQLLPMQFLGIICMEEADVDALEKDLQDRPWVFGFKQVGIVEKYPTPLYCVSLCNSENIFELKC